MSKHLQNNNNPQANLVVHHQKTEMFSGPLPHPDILQRFNDIVPGAAERILKMAEGQFEHRTALEKKVIESDIARSK